MYPRVYKTTVGMLRPVITGHALLPSGAVKDLTGLVSCKFFMHEIDERGEFVSTPKINGSAGALTDLANGILTYTPTGTDTTPSVTTVMTRYASWFIGYWGASSTVGEQFDGPEIYIYPAGTRLVR